MPRLKYIIISLRIPHWIKNAFVFGALIFSGQLFVISSLIKVAAAFILFSFISSAGYLINDIVDLEEDKKHPLKRNRLIASGILSARAALCASALLISVALPCSFWLNKVFGLILVCYFIFVIIYSLFLKYVVILDVFGIAGMFILRVISGGVVIHVDISSWLLICTGLISLFLGFAKRRHELILLKEDAQEHRKILSEYSPYFLDQMIAIVTTATLIAYIIYTILPDTIHRFETDKLIFTIPFVLYGVFRYLYLIHQRGRGEDPARLLFSDRALLIDVILWTLAVVMIIYHIY